MKSWKTSLGGYGLILCQIGAVIWPQFAVKFTAIGSILAGAGLIAARDNNVTSEQAHAPAASPVVAVKLMVLCLVGLTATGCATQFATETVRSPDGSSTTRRLVHNAILNKSALTNLAFAKKTKTTESLLSYDSAQTETQAEVMSKLVEGAVAGAVKGVK